MSSSGARILAIVAFLLAALSRAADKCYLLDGSPAGNDMQPCNPDSTFSACCATNKSTPDICMSSGLCYAQDGPFKGLIYADGCTDKTGKDKNCPQICQSLSASLPQAYNVLQCNPGQFCCRRSDDKANCCGTASLVVKVDIGTLLPSKSAQSTSPSTAKSSLPSNTASDICSEPTATESACATDRSAVVGGAVGGSLGAALLASLGVIAALYRRRMKSSRGYGANSAFAGSDKGYGPPPEQHRPSPAQELPGYSRTAHELQT